MHTRPDQFLPALQGLSHDNFNVRAYRPRFLKAFLHTGKLYFDDTLSSDARLRLADRCFRTLLLKERDDVRSLFAALTAALRPGETLEVFLSNLFCIVIDHYVKSFFGTAHTWTKIAKAVDAVDALIRWSSTLELSEPPTDADLTPEEIAIADLESIRRKQGKIPVLNTYYGVPIQYDARVVHTTPQSVYLDVHPIQMIAAEHQKGIYILGGDRVDYDLYAGIEPATYRDRRVLKLIHIDRLSATLNQRQTVRVHPRLRFEIHLSFETHRFATTLFDLSLGGMALIAKTRYTLPEAAALEVELPETMLPEPMRLKATLIHVSQYETGYKYHVRLHLNASQEQQIGKFITARQHEIVQELKQLAL